LFKEIIAVQTSKLVERREREKKEQVGWVVRDTTFNRGEES
jgi:hypothetical protein